jgi:hypothetical protein
VIESALEDALRRELGIDGSHLCAPIRAKVVSGRRP